MAEAFKRETGVRSLWLAYPLFHVVSREDEDRRSSILAPVFLWPIKVETPLNTQGRVVIRRDEEAGGPKYNKSLDIWITEHLAFNPDDPHLDDFAQATPAELDSVVSKLYSGLRPPPAVDLTSAPRAIPVKQTLQESPHPTVLNSGLFGLIQWEHQALIRDFEALGKMEKTTELLEDFLAGRAHDLPPLSETPSETHRFLVADADPSQERAVWLARSNPGVVVHGPPGTGKSQTIVNIVADALALGQRVLVVCQKRAAIDVVAERLKAHGLADVFCVAHDSESARQPIIRSLKAQMGQQIAPPNRVIAARCDSLAGEILRIEALLDEYTRAISERATVGLSFREILSRASKLFYENGAEPLQALSNLFRDKTLLELEPLAAPVMATGNLWDQADPLKNPWRFRIENISLGPIFTHAFDASLIALREDDGRHAAFIAANGVGSSFVSSPSAFIELADWWLPRLREVIDQQLLTLVGGWIQLSGDNGVLECAAAKLEPLLELGNKLAAEPLDTELTGKFAALDVTQARAQLQNAACVQRFYSKWWRWFKGEFRHAWNELKIFCGKPKLSTDEVNALARFLSAWLDREVLRNGIADLQVRFPAKSDEELTTATHFQSFAIQTARLLVEISAEPAFARLRKHFENRESAEVQAWIKDIQTTIERARIAESVIDKLKPFGKWLQDEFLVSLRAKVCAGESIGQEISEIEAGARQLDALQMLDESRMLREGFEREVLSALEQNQATQLTAETQALLGGRLRSFRLIWAGKIVANARHLFSGK